MKRTLFMLIVLSLALSGGDLSAQQTIKGQVVDNNQNPIASVNIQSSALEAAVKTDESGGFSINLTASEASIIFSHAGYIPQTLPVKAGSSFLTVILTEQIYPMDGVTVTAGRAVEGQTPVAFVNLDRETIDRDFDIGEFPALLENTPNVYAYSDAGGGLGYSYLKIRGFDAKRVPVYINGVPLNDPEDHSLYFVDLPDFASDVDDIQVQRGVGNSLYGDAAFGGSVNLLTSSFSRPRSFEISTGYGGFLQGSETVGLMRKSSVAYSTGLLNDGWSLSGRWVKQFSDGYRENSWYDGTAYYLSIGRLDEKMVTAVNIYGGPMKTHAAWDGIPRSVQAFDRRINFYDYDSETDNFNQPHFELHNIYALSENLTLNNTLFHIRGKGYYEQYRDSTDLMSYGLADDPDLYSDLVRRKWVDKNQYGINSRMVHRSDRQSSSLGASYYFFESEHWGEVIWAEELSPSLLNYSTPDRYYEYFGKYHNFSTYASHLHQVSDKLTVSGNLQLRYLRKNIHQTAMEPYEGRIYTLDWLFLSPRVGATYDIDNNWSAFAGFSIASHEPNDEMIDDADDPGAVPRLEIIDDSVDPVVYGEATVDPERIYDFELGARYRRANMSFDINLFWMDYKNEVVPNGQLNDDGQPTVGNAERSLHCGIETVLTYKPWSYLTVEGNYSFNDNWIKEYDQLVSADSIISHNDVAVPGFPKYLANLALDFKYGSARLVYRLRAVGRQFINYDGRYSPDSLDVSIAPYTVSSIKGILNLGNLLGGAEFVLEGRVDNLFDAQYETFGYEWGDYGYYAYWPAAERNWFVTLKMKI
ncbi:MAG: TonB-dependent receptor [FCB group bacterium]|nr:TonB-dependent receptor [FCB group bacterium]